MPFMRTSTILLALVSTIAFTSACSHASYAKIESAKRSPTFQGGPGKNILVVVATADVAMRQDVETEFAIQAVDRGLNLTPSHRLVANLKDVTRESLVELVKENGIDRVVVVRTLPKTATTGKQTDYRDYYTVHDLPVGLWETWPTTTMIVFSPTDPPPTMGRYVTFDVETVMYDAASASPIWASTARVTSGESAGEAGRAFVKEVLNGLRSDGLL